MMMQRSSSAIADTMTMMALPSGPSVSIASRCERNWMPNPFKLVKSLEQVLGAPRKPVARPDHQHVELVTTGVVHHPVELGSPRPRSTESAVRVLAARSGNPLLAAN